MPWTDRLLTGIYTLTPTHCGTGQTTGAVDLPVARDAATGFPILPATSLKGVARDYASAGDLTDSERDRLFGPPLSDRERDIRGEAATRLEAGALSFTEGRLVAYPVRSLNRPFLHTTCPLILRGLERDLRALGLPPLLEGIDLSGAPEKAQAWVADSALEGNALVLEDLAYEADEVRAWSDLGTLGERLAGLLPEGETYTRALLTDGLVLVPDADFQDLMQRAIPVQARIKLGEGKTTGDGGNLWYEEHLPSDCLFVSAVGERRQRRSGSAESESTEKETKPPLERLREVWSDLATVQLGGNETVGQGLCWWTRWQAGEASGSGTGQSQ
jgi:CRISPR-associated protein Cmr4